MTDLKPREHADRNATRVFVLCEALIRFYFSELTHIPQR